MLVVLQSVVAIVGQVDTLLNVAILAGIVLQIDVLIVLQFPVLVHYLVESSIPAGCSLGDVTTVGSCLLLECPIGHIINASLLTKEQSE